MARYKADTISQLMRHGYWISVKCRCGNNATLNPQRLLNARKVGLGTTIEQLYGKLSCKVCGQRPWDVCATFEPGK